MLKHLTGKKKRYRYFYTLNEWRVKLVGVCLASQLATDLYHKQIFWVLVCCVVIITFTFSNKMLEKSKLFLYTFVVKGRSEKVYGLYTYKNTSNCELTHRICEISGKIILCAVYNASCITSAFSASCF